MRTLLIATAVAAAAGALLVAGRDDAPAADPAIPVVVSVDGLSAAAGGDAYWAGPRSGQALELTRTADGTFVRYLPTGVRAGDPRRSLTIATYPLRDAYATALRRAKGKGMTSRQLDPGVAVWSIAQPTSVYVAFPGVPQLVEVYAPDRREARRVAFRSISPVP